MRDTAKLNRLLSRARAQAEQEHEHSPLTAMYEQALLRIAADAARSFSTLTAVAWQPQPEGALLRALEATAAAITTTQAKLHARILRLVTSDPLERLGIAWDVKHPLSQALLAKAGQRTGARLGEAVQPILRDTIAAAYEQGLPVAETAALIRDNLVDAAPWQAEMLARTDLNGLANGGSVIAAKLAGASFKTWEATLDDRTRESHADAHGQTVPVDAAFDVGGEQLEFPGDPAGSDAEVANCRCTVTYQDSLTAASAVRAPTGRLSSRGTMATALEDTTLTAAGVTRSIPISGVAAIEGSVTRDSSPMPRILLSRSLGWDEMPVPFMAKTVTAEGHDGAEVAGRIDSFRRTKGEDGTWHIAFTGALTTPYGIDEIAPMIDDETLRGVSADLGAAEWAIVDRETLAEVPEDELDIEAMASGKYFVGLTKGQILGVTLCQGQAIAGATVALTASGGGVAQSLIELSESPIKVEDWKAAAWRHERKTLTAAAAPARPPREWFETQEPPGEMPLTITDDGRVFGHLALWKTCHTGLANVCTTPPRSASGYAYFHVGELELDDGEKIAVGKLMLASKGGKHAPLSASRAEASRHYDDTSMVAAYLRASDGQHGIWVAGALNPALTDGRVQELRTLPPSGDWREVNGRLDMIAALAVPVPGFPVPRAEAALIASADELTLSALVASSGRFDPEPHVIRALAAAGLCPDQAADDARTRAIVARAEGGIEGLLELATEGAAP